FWAGNTPLYPWTLFDWFGLVGFSLAAGRALSVLIFAVACGLLWFVVRRKQWVATPGWRLALVAVLLLSHGSFGTWRNGRPDALWVVFGGGVVAAESLIFGLARGFALVILGALIPPAGLQLIVVMGFSTAVVVLLWPRLLGPAFCLLIGVLAGAAILYG